MNKKVGFKASKRFLADKQIKSLHFKSIEKKNTEVIEDKDKTEEEITMASTKVRFFTRRPSKENRKNRLLNRSMQVPDKEDRSQRGTASMSRRTTVLSTPRKLKRRFYPVQSSMMTSNEYEVSCSSSRAQSKSYIKRYSARQSPDQIEDSEFIPPSKFTKQINQIVQGSYMNFKNEKVISRTEEMKQLLRKYFEDYQIMDLIKIGKIRVYPIGTVIKQRDEGFDRVFVIEKGEMGLYVYSYRVQEVVGEYNLNFISSKAAQYEALTDLTVIEFPREEYENITFQFKNKIYKENHEYFTENFEVFNKLNMNKMKKL